MISQLSPFLKRIVPTLDLDRAKSDLSLGSSIVHLLADPSWIHRRVETITLRPDGETRRQISFDFVLPERCRFDPGEIETGSGRRAGRRVVVPLGFMRKGTLVDLDVTDESGRTMPVLTLGQNGQIAFHAMRYLLRELGDNGAHDDALRDVIYSRVGDAVAGRYIESQRRETFTDIARRSAGDMPEPTIDLAHDAPRVQQLAEWLAGYLTKARRPELTMLASLLAGMSEDYIFAVEVDSEYAGTRAVLKVSYASRIRSIKRPFERLRHSEGWQLGVATSAAESTHLEIETTPGLQITELRSIRTPTVQQTPFLGEPVLAAHRVHVFTNRRHTSAAAFTYLKVSVVPVRFGTVAYSLFATAVNLVAQILLVVFGPQVVANATLNRDLPLSEVAEQLGPIRDTTAATIVTLALSLAAAVLVVVQFHDVERKVTFTSRFLILASACLFSLALVSLTFDSWASGIPSGAGDLIRLTTCGFSAGALIWAYGIWTSASPGRAKRVLRDRFHTPVERAVAKEASGAGLAATESALFNGLSVSVMSALAHHFARMGRK